MGQTERPHVLGSQLLSVQRLGLHLLSMLKEDGRNGMEGTQVSGVRARWCGLEEGAAGKLFTCSIEVHIRPMRAVAGVAENDLGYSDRKRLRTFWMVQYG